MRYALLLSLGVLVAAGCGDDGASEADTASDTAAADTVTADTTNADGLGGDTREPADSGAADVDDVEDVADAGPEDVKDVGHGEPDGGGLIGPFMLSGTAEGDDAELDVRVECSFFGTIDQIVATETGWEGVAVGEVFRVILPDTRRFEFSAFVAGPTTLDVVDEHVELRWVGDQTGGNALWRALEVLTGDATSDGYAGAWSCAPLGIDLGGYVDDELTVDGTWTIGPAPANP